MPDEAPSTAQIWRTAWPIIVANVAVPLLGLTDTAILGRTGEIEDLGAIALGSLVFNFVYWTFGFLRMGTTGLVARAHGASDHGEVRLIVGRALLLGFGIGLLLLVVQRPIELLAVELLDASADVETRMLKYVRIRLWGAPAALASFAVTGTLIGLRQSKALLTVQLLMNGFNLILDLVFAVGLHWGIAGIGAGTAVAEWLAVLIGLSLTWRVLPQSSSTPLSWIRLIDLGVLRTTLVIHSDIMLRTLLLLLGFAWFAQQGARFGDVTLASNHVLLQFISFSAFFLDGIAFAAESFVGHAAGAGQRRRLEAVVRRSTRLAFAIATALASILLAVGPFAVHWLTDLSEVAELSRSNLPFAASYVMVAVFAFQLDGVFIGATRSRDMRNASLVSVALFWVLGTLLIPPYENHGLWLAFIGYAAARAVTLGVLYPRLKASVGASENAPDRG